MTILITGATGLIGGQLTQMLLAAGHKVHFLTTRANKILNKDNHKGFLWDPKKRQLDKGCFEDVSTIVHLVGATVSEPWTKKYRQEILDSRIDTMRLIEDSLAELKHQVTHFISASGISIYPDSPTTEYTVFFSGVADNFLGQVVVAWEAAADRFKDLGMTVAKVRTGVVLDTDQGALPQIAKPVKMGAGAVLGSGKQWFSWIHLQDICGIYAFLIEKQAEGIFNAVAPHPVTNKALTHAVANQLGKKVILPAVPGFVLKLALGERASLVLEGQKVSAAKVGQLGYSFEFPELAGALAQLYPKGK